MKSLRVIALLCVAALAACGEKPDFRTPELKGGADFGGNFTLTAHNGSRVSTADYRGKVQVVFFGYAHCPDICSPVLARIAQAVKSLGEEAGKVQVWFVTVDPKKDTVKVLADFVPKFHPAFIGLTGSEAEIVAVTKDHKVAYMPRPGAPDIIDHFGGILVKDVRGRLRMVMRGDTAPEDIAHDLRLFIREGG
jgi:protein SCO1/2